jgi:quercetin dioxygenase-like cupin family protein
MPVVHTRLADAQWIEVDRGVHLAPLHVIGDGAGTAFLRFQPGAVSGSHRHPGGEELYVISGRLRVGDRTLEAGDFLLTPPGGIHDAEAEEETLTLISVPEPIEFL